MTSSESLFDNNINSEPPVLSTAPTTTTNDDSNLDIGKTLITYRILVSRREAGAIIGKEGSNITTIREKYDIKAGVSKVIDGCIDRILTVNGMVDKMSSALIAIAQSVLDANISTIKECEANGSNPLRLINYDYLPLKPLTQRPSYQDVDYNTTLFLRILIPNSQIGTLIGKGGIRIKSIQETNNIKMVASKDFMENSNERLIELQGTSTNLKNALDEISRYLLTDYQSTVPTNYYIPCAPLENPKFNPNYINGRRNYHPTTQSLIDSRNNSGKEIIKKISFPNEYIGALIGKRGSRIQEIRVLSQCAVAIENENLSGVDENDREITLVGTKGSVEKAIDLLNMYYEREQKRRMNDE